MATQTSAASRDLHRPRVRLRISTGMLSVVAGILLWQVLVVVFKPNPLTIVAPTDIAEKLRTLVTTGDLWPHLSISMKALAIGYVGCALVTVPLGLVIGSSERFYQLSAPWISALYATPIIALAPIVVINFGFGLMTKVVVVALSAMFPMLISTVTGARTVAGELRDVGTVFGVTRTESFVKVVAPGSLVFILTGLKLAVGRALIGVVAADLFGASAGLGYMLLRSTQTFDSAGIYAVVVIVAALGVALTSALEWIERRYRRRVYGESS